jgi:NAD(P)-dependent dehydrogenase (short-subunit alcohol dehydrogenase family)
MMAAQPFDGGCPDNLNGNIMSTLDKFRLDGHVAVVTGGGRGIGRAIALGLAEAGADIVLAARRTAEIDAVAEEVNALGRRGLGITTDMMDMDQIENLAEQTVKEMGKLSIWVNNAGGADDRTMRNLIDLPEYQWDFQAGLNMKAVWAGSIAAAKRMDEGSSIINISSVAAFNAAPANGPYAAAKAGVNSLTKTLAAELAPKIRVNAIAPGPIPTEVFMEALNLTEEMLPMVAESIGIPMGRLGLEEDIAPAAIYLASEASNWITGQVLTVSGGL